MEDANQAVPDSLYDMAYIPRDKRKKPYQVPSSHSNGYSRPSNTAGTTGGSSSSSAYNGNRYESRYSEGNNNNSNNQSMASTVSHVNAGGGSASQHSNQRVSRFGDRVQNGGGSSGGGGGTNGFYGAAAPVSSFNGASDSDWAMPAAPPPLPTVNSNGYSAVSAEQKSYGADSRYKQMGYYVPPPPSMVENGAFSGFD